MAVATGVSPRTEQKVGVAESTRRSHRRESGASAVDSSARMLEIQRARVLGALLEVSAERGVVNVSIAHVVDRAGVSRRTFYELYADREDCVLAAMNDGIERAARQLFEVYDPAAAWPERVRVAVHELLSFFESDRATAQLLVVGSLAAGPRPLVRRTELVAALVAAVDEGRKLSHEASRLPPLTAEGAVGGVLSVLHSRLISSEPGRLLELAGPLTSIVVFPYLGSAVARSEAKRRPPAAAAMQGPPQADPLRDLEMRMTYRTVRVLMAVAAFPSRSNRDVGETADIHDQGQISKLLTRLARLGLIENTPSGRARGAPNAWTLTPKGERVARAIGARAG